MKQVVVIGGGIVGLATAYHILQTKQKIRLVLLEKEVAPAQHQTGNNSGVIHSGIYYKPGSLKAKNCLEGYRMLLKFCNKHEIPVDLCGKIIVAADESELTSLQNIYERGRANGLNGIKVLSAKQIQEHEPFAAGIKGLFVPQTGIVNYRAVSQTLEKEVLRLGGEIRYHRHVQNIIPGSTIHIETDSESVTCDFLVSAAGLYSDKIAKMTHPDANFQIIPFRGEYYKITPSKANLVRNLIYPVPDPDFPFLGVHFTRRIDGSIEAGPNAVLAFAREGYKKSTINISELIETLRFSGFRSLARKYWRTGLGEIYRSVSKRAFTKALKKLVPAIQRQDLTPAGAGVRAQACYADGTLVDDFLILEKNNIIHVCNAPSPAATSSLAIGRKITERFLSAG